MRFADTLARADAPNRRTARACHAALKLGAAAQDSIMFVTRMPGDPWPARLIADRDSAEAKWFYWLHDWHVRLAARRP